MKKQLVICYRIKNKKVECWDFDGQFAGCTFNDVFDMKKYWKGADFIRYTKKDFIMNGMDWEEKF